MIFDAFPFFDELDLLEIRLNELGDVVDRFIIVESRMTFTGKPKPLHFRENRHRFDRWLDKICPFIVSSLCGDTPAQRDNFQRNRVAGFAAVASPGDVVILSDLDEIPRASVVKAFHPEAGIQALGMPMYRFYINCLSNEPWDRAKILPGAALAGRTGEQIRWRMNEVPTIPNAGWHFTSTGGADRLAYKLDSFAHNDCPHNADMVAQVRAGTWWETYGKPKLSVVAIDGSYPAFVRENFQKIKEWGLVYEPAVVGV